VVKPPTIIKNMTEYKDFVETNKSKNFSILGYTDQCFMKQEQEEEQKEGI